MVVEPIFGGQEVQKAQNVKNRDVEKRNEARKRKDFAMADTIRHQLLEKGIILEDSGERTLWRRAK